jgi:hypothetical protein
MNKKHTAQSGLFSLRPLAVSLSCAMACCIVAGAVMALFRSEAPIEIPHTALTFAERVAYQRAIEEVYWRYRIWPKDRPDPKPSLDALISHARPDFFSKPVGPSA